MRARLGLLALALVGLAVPAGAEDAAKPIQAEASRYYSPDENAEFVLETGLAEARERGSYAVFVFGADWCHDSTELARVLTSPAFKARYGGRFHVSFVDVGKPQTGQGRNLTLVDNLGLKRLRSTPALFVLSGAGKRLNAVSDARSWRNAAARGEDKILAWFDRFLAVRSN